MRHIVKDFDKFENFTRDEMKCPCCDRCNMDLEFMSRLQAARTIAGIAFNLSSGFRCNYHNSEVGGVVGSLHTFGEAVDIIITSDRERLIIARALLLVGFTHIKVKQNYIHIDSSDKLALWLR